jgi:mannosyltransferase OCH1-like enzyme
MAKKKHKNGGKKIYNKFMRNIIYLLCILIISFCFIFLKKREIEGFERDNKIPKIIWTYWDNPQVPDFVEKCRKNWEKFAPNYEIRYLNKNNIENYVTNMPENWQSLPPYRQADVLRLKLLEKYGGIWMDASILLMENPDKFVGGDVTLFTSPMTTNADPIYENWFIASTPNNKIIKKWIVEVEKAIKDPKAYLASISEYNKKLVEDPEYLICHLALRNIYDNQKDIFKNGNYYNSNETAFYEHKKYNWKDVCMNAFKDFNIHPERLMIKLTRFDRESNNQNKVDIPSVLIA